MRKNRERDHLFVVDVYARGATAEAAATAMRKVLARVAKPARPGDLGYPIDITDEVGVYRAHTQVQYSIHATPAEAAARLQAKKDFISDVVADVQSAGDLGL